MEREGHLLLDGPVESVESQDSQVRFVRGITSTSQEELDELGDVFSEDGNFLLSAGEQKQSNAAIK